MRIPARTVALALGFAAAILAADPLFERCWNKFDSIDSGRVKPGSVVAFTPGELNAWVKGRVPQMFEGVRDPQVQLETGAATGSALVDFVKIRQGQGLDTNIFLRKLLDGERSLKVSARLESGHGRATVYLTSVELAGVVLSGSLLDFLIKDVFQPLFPDAKVNQSFELRDNIERIEIRPDTVHVFIKK